MGMGEMRHGFLCSKVLKDRLSKAIQHFCSSSIYEPESTVRELTTAQSLLLGLLYGLLYKDISLCSTLLYAAISVVQLESTFLKIWLRDDFFFMNSDIVSAFTNLAEMMDDNLVQLPNNILAALSELISKYQLLEQFRQNGDVKAQRLMETFASRMTGISRVGTLNSPLAKAVQNNDTAMIRALLASGADIDEETDTGDNILHIAVASGSLEAVTELIDAGAVIQWRNSDYVTPILMALHLYNVPMIEVLLKFTNINDQTPEGNNLLHDMASEGNTEGIKLLLRHGFSLNSKNLSGETPLHIAVKRNHLTAVETLIAEGADVSIATKEGDRPIHIAVKHSNFKIVKTLIGHNIGVNLQNISGLSPLHLATDTRIIKLLTAKGANINSRSFDCNTPLHVAVINNRTEAVKTLIALHAEVNSLDSNSCTPLYVAANCGYVDVVDMLIAGGSDVNYKQKTGDQNSFLHKAAEEGNVDVIRILLDNGADVNVLNKRLWTPLHYAAKNNHKSIAELLLERGANINSASNVKDTPLLWAASKGHVQLVKLLLQKGANVNDKNKNGFTSLDVANGNKHTAIAELLTQYGGTK